MRHRSWFSNHLIRFLQGINRLLQHFADHLIGRRKLLLLKYEQWLVKIRIHFMKKIQKFFHLKILTSKTQNSDSCHIGMIGVSGQKTSERRGILPRATSASLIRQNLDPIDVLKRRLTSASSPIPAMLTCRQSSDKLTISIRTGISEFSKQGLFCDFQVPCFTKH